MNNSTGRLVVGNENEMRENCSERQRISRLVEITYTSQLERLTERVLSLDCWSGGFWLDAIHRPYDALMFS